MKEHINVKEYIKRERKINLPQRWPVSVNWPCLGQHFAVMLTHLEQQKTDESCHP